MGQVAERQQRYDDWTAVQLSMCDTYSAEKRRECKEDYEAKLAIAGITLQNLQGTDRATWKWHNDQILRIGAAGKNLSTTREDMIIWCDNARSWRHDVQSALSFIQELDDADLIGKEAQLMALNREHSKLVRQCVAIGQ